jgi:ketosteroid isomerase-like protein
MSDKVTAEEVRETVKRVWDANTSKKTDALAAMYATGSSVFTTDGVRPEPGKLVAMKREREYFHKDASMQVDLGPIEVDILSDLAAVAYYTFNLHVKQKQISPGKFADEDMPTGRITQVIQRQSDGKLLVIHEHLSVPME